LASAASSRGSKSFSVLVRIDFTIIVNYFGERSELSRFQILFGIRANRLGDYCQFVLASAASSGGSKSFSVLLRIDFMIIVDYFSELRRLQILFGSRANRLGGYYRFFCRAK
jgi:hypothetical protein